MKITEKDIPVLTQLLDLLDKRLQNIATRYQDCDDGYDEIQTYEQKIQYQTVQEIRKDFANLAHELNS